MASVYYIHKVFLYNLYFLFTIILQSIRLQMFLLFLYICVLEYIFLFLPQFVQPLVHESKKSKEKYWRYNTLWKPYDDTADYKKILSDFLSTMSEMENLRTAVVTVTDYIDPLFINDYYKDMFTRDSNPTTTRFRRKEQVITQFPYRYPQTTFLNYRHPPKLYFRRKSQTPNLPTKIITKNKASYEENYEYGKFWPRQDTSKLASLLQQRAITKYSTRDSSAFDYRPQYEINRIQNYEQPMFRPKLHNLAPFLRHSKVSDDNITTRTKITGVRDKGFKYPTAIHFNPPTEKTLPEITPVFQPNEDNDYEVYMRRRTKRPWPPFLTTPNNSSDLTNENKSAIQSTSKVEENRKTEKPPVGPELFPNTDDNSKINKKPPKGPEPSPNADDNPKRNVKPPEGPEPPPNTDDNSKTNVKPPEGPEPPPNTDDNSKTNVKPPEGPEPPPNTDDNSKTNVKPPEGPEPSPNTDDNSKTNVKPPEGQEPSPNADDNSETNHPSQPIIITSNSTSTDSEDDVEVYCYMCGLNLTEIPRPPTCFEVFDSSSKSPYFPKYKYAVRCVKNKSSKRSSNEQEFSGDLYRGGCFKRFTDIGKVYNERGCRTKEPNKGMSFASHRLAKLELLLHDKDDDCVSSPHASLTPFSRAISLFVRYHVCVCKGRLCNHTTPLYEPPFANLRLIAITHIFLYVCKSN